MLKIGWAEEDITPKQKISLAGQFFERISDQVETPISVTAMAVESGEEQMIICSCDLVAVSTNLLELAREKMRGRLPIAPEKVVVGATHTHTSYLYNRGSNATGKITTAVLQQYSGGATYHKLVSDEQSMDPGDALEFLAGRIADAAVKAWENLKPAVFAGGFGRAAVGMNRRVCYDDGSAKMWGDTNSANFTALEGGNDSGIEILFTFDTDKKLTGVVANVACPSQVLEHRSFISSDYWGKVRINLRERFGDDLFVLCLCSAAGDQCPRDLIRWVDPETPINDPNIHRDPVLERRADPSMFDIKGAVKAGRRIAREIIDAFEEITEYQEDAVLVHKIEHLGVPLRRVTVAEYEAAIAKLEAFAKENAGSNLNFEDNARLHLYTGTVARYIYQKTHDIENIEVHVIRLGDIAFATNPFELFLDYGNQIRARSLAKQTFLIQLSCGAHGYLPTEKAEHGSHYSAYVTSGITGHAGGELLVRTTLTDINAMFQK